MACMRHIGLQQINIVMQEILHFVVYCAMSCMSWICLLQHPWRP